MKKSGLSRVLLTISKSATGQTHKLVKSLISKLKEEFNSKNKEHNEIQKKDSKGYSTGVKHRDSIIEKF